MDMFMGENNGNDGFYDYDWDDKIISLNKEELYLRNSKIINLNKEDLYDDTGKIINMNKD